MKRRSLVGLLIAVGLIAGLYYAAPIVNRADADEGKAPLYKISKETTYFTEPLDENGHVDFVAALNNLYRQEVKTENNVMAALVPVLGPKPEGAKLDPKFYQLIGVPEPPLDGHYLMDIGKYEREILKKPGPYNYERHESLAQYPWDLKDYPELEGWLKYNDQAIALALEACDRSQYYHPLTFGVDSKGPQMLIGALLPSIQKCREIAYQFKVRSMLLLQQNKPLEAWKYDMATQRLGRAICNSHGTLIELLVGIAITAIANDSHIVFLDQAKLTREQLQKCIAEYEELPPIQGLAKRLDVGERIFFLDSAKFISMGVTEKENEFKDFLDRDDLKQLGVTDVRTFDWNAVLTKGNAFYDKMVIAVSQPTRQARVEKFIEIDKELKEMIQKQKGPNSIWRYLKPPPSTEERTEKLLSILLSLLAPALQKVQESHELTVQQGVNTKLAFQLALYKLDNKQYPDKWEDMIPKYLAKVPNDLFVDQPLKYRKTEKGYLLYSVGQNGKDDGGRGRFYRQRNEDDWATSGDDYTIEMPVKKPKPKENDQQHDDGMSLPIFDK